MSFAQLQSFVVVAEEQHLTRAAPQGVHDAKGSNRPTSLPRGVHAAPSIARGPPYSSGVRCTGRETTIDHGQGRD